MKLIVYLALLLSGGMFRSAFAATLAISDVDGNYNEEGSWGVAGPTSPSSPGTRAAFPITLAAGKTYQVNQIGVAAHHESWGNEYSVRIYQGPDYPLSLVLESVHRTLPQGNDDATHAATTYFDFSDGALLVGGVTYWIALENMVNGASDWARSDTVLGPMARITSPTGDWFFNGPNNPLGSYIVLGEAVPEPTTMSLVCCAIALAPRRRC